MNFQRLKLVLVVVLLSGFLAACSSTPPDTSASDTSGMSTDNVMTGSVGDVDVDGSGVYQAGGVETVFYFDFDKSTLKSEALAALRQHAANLKARPVNIRLQGHGDERGTREYNMALGERRGNAVREFLVLQGVDGSMMEVVSYGEESPAAMGSDESSWSLNRRVELK